MSNPPERRPVQGWLFSHHPDGLVWYENMHARPIAEHGATQAVVCPRELWDQIRDDSKCENGDEEVLTCVEHEWPEEDWCRECRRITAMTLEHSPEDADAK